MIHPPVSIFSFEYRHAGKNYVLDVPAWDQADAEARFASIARATYIGRLRELEKATTDGAGL